MPLSEIARPVPERSILARAGPDHNNIIRTNNKSTTLNPVHMSDSTAFWCPPNCFNFDCDYAKVG